jgi:hypothetical protein
MVGLDIDCIVVQMLMFYQIARSWESKRSRLAEAVLLAIVNAFGLNANIWDEELRAYRPPTTQEFADRVEYLISPDLRYLCREFDDKVRQFTV